MDRIYAFNASPTPTPVPTTYETGYPQEGLISTELGAYWYYMITQELYNAIAALGVTPDKNMVNQLATGLIAMQAVMNNADAKANTAQTIVPFGAFLPWPGPTPPTGYIKANGIYLPRTGSGSFPLLTTAVLGGGLNMIDDASWSTNPGCYTLGNGSSTIRIPDGRGLSLKGHHDGSGAYTTNTTRRMGAYEGDQILAHKHIVSTQAGTNGGWNLAQTDRGGYDYAQPRDTSTVGGLENLIRNISILWCLRAY